MIKEAVAAVRKISSAKPQVAIILGTGLGALSTEIKSAKVIPYADIPHMPRPTFEAHAGRLVIGKLGGKDVVALDGRFHRYEGYSLQEITLPVRVAKALGAKILVVSNAAGGMNPQYSLGQLVIIEDHINLMGDNPLIGVNDDALGPRFPDMSEPYDRKLIALAEERALALGIPVKLGVYVGVTGPNLETRAEYRFLRMIGADVVGMSTVPEVIVAAQAGLRVLGCSIVTDLCLPDRLEKADIVRIIATANAAEPHLARLVKDIIVHL
jgi:purine-nucleoside phosphorylase